MMKRNVLLDIDGVIADFHTSFASFLNEKYNANLDVSVEPHTYTFEEWGSELDHIDMEKAANEWILDGGFLTVNPYNGAREFVEKLIKISNVHIVTARIGDFRNKFTDDQINQIKNDSYDWFIKHNIPTNGRIRFDHKKVDLCLKDGISILIEDKLSTALMAAKEGIHSIIIDRGWNKHTDRLRVYRAYNYDDILDLVKKLST